MNGKCNVQICLEYKSIISPVFYLHGADCSIGKSSSFVDFDIVWYLISLRWHFQCFDDVQLKDLIECLIHW